MTYDEPVIVNYGVTYIIVRHALSTRFLWNAAKREWVDDRDIHAGRTRSKRASYFRSKEAAQRAVIKATANGWA